MSANRQKTKLSKDYQLSKNGKYVDFFRQNGPRLELDTDFFLIWVLGEKCRYFVACSRHKKENQPVKRERVKSSLPRKPRPLRGSVLLNKGKELREKLFVYSKCWFSVSKSPKKRPISMLFLPKLCPS